MAREYSFQTTKERYNYMLPVFGLAGTVKHRLVVKNDRGVDKYYFIGTHEDYNDFLSRCKYMS